MLLLDDVSRSLYCVTLYVTYFTGKEKITNLYRLHWEWDLLVLWCWRLSLYWQCCGAECLQSTPHPQPLQSLHHYTHQQPPQHNNTPFLSSDLKKYLEIFYDLH